MLITIDFSRLLAMFNNNPEAPKRGKFCIDFNKEKKKINISCTIKTLKPQLRVVRNN